MIAYIRKSFRRELLCCFVVVALLPLILTACFLIQLFQVKLAADYKRQDLEQAESIENILHTQFTQFEEAAEQICTDDVVILSMQNQTLSEENEIYSRLYAATTGMRDMAQFDIYTREGECKCTTGAVTAHSKLPDYWGILRVAEAHPEDLIIQSKKDYTQASDILLQAARGIQDEEENTVGFLIISLRAENFEHLLEGQYGGQDGICVLNRFWENVYSTGTAEKQDIANALRELALAGREVPENYQDHHICIFEIPDTGLYSVYLHRTALTEDNIRTMYQVSLFMAMVSLMLCVIVSVNLSKNLTNPLSRMKDAMQEVQKGNLMIQMKADRQDEFGSLAKHFNTMTVKLKEYMDRQVHQQKELDEVNIAMMQAQLNPHFLYNTLDTMKWMAKANGIPELAVMATRLARILRTAISKDSFISLEEELELVKSYAEIQKIRFQDAFCFTVQVPEELLDCIVPKLMIQPLVENAVLHGLTDRRDGHVTVRVHSREESLVIEVEDDGCGIPKDILENLRNRNQKRRTGHIGFCNVDTIIRLNYGEPYGLKVDTPERGGTLVIIEIPVRRESELC